MNLKFLIFCSSLALGMSIFTATCAPPEQARIGGALVCFWVPMNALVWAHALKRKPKKTRLEEWREKANLP